MQEPLRFLNVAQETRGSPSGPRDAPHDPPEAEEPRSVLDDPVMMRSLREAWAYRRADTRPPGKSLEEVFSDILDDRGLRDEGARDTDASR